MYQVLKDQEVVEILEKAEDYEDFRYYWGVKDMERKHRITPSPAEYQKLVASHELSHVDQAKVVSIHSTPKPLREVKSVKDVSSGWWQGVVHIVEEKQRGKIQGQWVDLTTAGMLYNLGKQMPTKIFDKFTSLHISQAVDVGWKAVR